MAGFLYIDPDQLPKQPTWTKADYAERDAACRAYHASLQGKGSDAWILAKVHEYRLGYIPRRWRTERERQLIYDTPRAWQPMGEVDAQRQVQSDLAALPVSKIQQRMRSVRQRINDLFW
jgi:hypothetical protein